MKADKIKLALEKLKEAKVKKVRRPSTEVSSSDLTSAGNRKLERRCELRLHGHHCERRHVQTEHSSFFCFFLVEEPSITVMHGHFHPASVPQDSTDPSLGDMWTLIFKAVNRSTDMCVLRAKLHCSINAKPNSFVPIACLLFLSQVMMMMIFIHFSKLWLRGVISYISETVLMAYFPVKFLEAV